VQKPGVPIVVGGHTEMAARRAARYGDGFFPAVADDRSSPGCSGSCARSAPSSAAIRHHRDHVGPRRARRRWREAPRDIGVSRFMVPPPRFDPDGVTEGLEKLGNLIAR
jgi:alkanesulfonate monooxygenase SsuD/methylene tetrahydromethanopterin reductase-like flavin-dependent oxidoreductase (luciferase family)